MCLFSSWRIARNQRTETTNYVPQHALVDFTVDELNTWLPMFVSEITKENGSNYKAKTLFEYILTIQSAISIANGVYYGFLKEPKFTPIKNALDRRMKSLQALGLGYNPSKAEVITEEIEELLWNGGFLGLQSPFRH